jgi:hypothetical protein
MVSDCLESITKTFGIDVMNQDILAQARRFYHHVVNGGKLKPEDVSYMVSALEEAYDNMLTDEEQVLFEKLKKIWVHSIPEESGLYFICGEGGDRDQMGLPEMILVCPSYGLDGVAAYKKATEYSAPEW